MQPKPILRLKEIIGDEAANPPIPPIVPVSRSTWYRGISEGLFPKGVQISRGCVGWLRTDIENLVAKIGLGTAFANIEHSSSSSQSTSQGGSYGNQ